MPWSRSTTDGSLILSTRWRRWLRRRARQHPATQLSTSATEHRRVPSCQPHQTAAATMPLMPQVYNTTSRHDLPRLLTRRGILLVTRSKSTLRLPLLFQSSHPLLHPLFPYNRAIPAANRTHSTRHPWLLTLTSHLQVRHLTLPDSPAHISDQNTIGHPLRIPSSSRRTKRHSRMSGSRTLWRPSSS